MPTSAWPVVVARTENLKLTFTCPASLKADLERYAALHSHTYGEEVDALTLIPHMLEAFMARDRVFKRNNKPALSAAPQTTDPR
ncbi:DUF2274 domain-containing protein [Ectopseudomonas mendocina]|uniref:DUF2274 domain-containing protein n=1 Tax=Ectopseudomonas mendocina TaxID=300 RepID=A0ABD7RMS2_ECTME|nr:MULTISPECIES: DUF2274 domain-containing protein [Pseudomonas aeruginosa group]EKS2409373.1 DUF2274 domain-containing protein [Pseudomonas aeruginosa]MCV0280558.1 DUF2274 domain-containing protein [Pseudomonas aeruginosa]TRO08052.1 DUF2274 domain-containing protein [Pseudomonas mendocina]TRO10750.1 DUF2274 domain-containing protein [Pseudomonas mendocina]